MIDWSVECKSSNVWFEYEFLIEKACERLGKLRSVLTTIMDDKVSSNGVGHKDLI